MSVIEDSRKLVQDFLAPELRSIASRLTALEDRYNSLDRKVDQVDDWAEKRHEAALGFLRDSEDRSSKRHAEVMDAIARTNEVNFLRERIVRLEAASSPHQ